MTSNYIIEKMAQVGCGTGDISIIENDCDFLNKNERDILDCWHNNGFDIELLPEFKEIASNIKSEYSEDDLICMGAYVSARRNIEQY